MGKPSGYKNQFEWSAIVVELERKFNLAKSCLEKIERSTTEPRTAQVVGSTLLEIAKTGAFEDVLFLPNEKDDCENWEHGGA